MSGFDVDFGEENHLGLGPPPGQYGADTYTGMEDNRDQDTPVTQQQQPEQSQQPNQAGDPPSQQTGNAAQQNGSQENGDVKASVPTNVYISNLHWWTTDAELEGLCSEFGQLLGLKFMEERATGKSKGTAVAEFSSRESAVQCKEGLNGRSIQGRPCTVSFTPPSSRAGPPPGRGPPGGGPPPRPGSTRFSTPRDEGRGRDQRGRFGMGDRGGMQGGMGMPPLNPLGMPGVPGMMMGGMPGMMMGMPPIGGMPPMPGMGMPGMMPMPGGMPFPMDDDSGDERGRERMDGNDGYRERDFDRDGFKRQRH